MTQKQVKVTFQPTNRSVFVLPGTKITEAAARAGITINTPCGSAGTCGKCVVQVMENVEEPTDADRRFFDDEQLGKGFRLACQTSINGEMKVSIPRGSRLDSQHKIVTEGVEGGDRRVVPSVRKVYVELDKPTLEDNCSDMFRLEKSIGKFKTDLTQLRKLPSLLRANDYKGTAVLTDHHLIDFEAGDTTGECFGVAFDIGTTTIVGSLVDLNDGSEAAITAQMNPQVPFGDDVLSRIKHSSSCRGCLDELSHLVRSSIIEMIDVLCERAGVDRGKIYEIVFAGNTTMEHLLCGIDPTPLGQMPFVPAHSRGLLLGAQDLGIPISHNARAYVFPVIGGFVGGDTVGGILASELAEGSEAVLMVDIGTNGEIVLAENGRVWAASTAAGPAFEGARISCGMRATTGAIEKIVFNGDVEHSVIGNVSAVGICGSALIDLAAELLKAGIVTSTGEMRGPGDLPCGLPEELVSRVIKNDEGQVEFVVSDARHGDKDVRVVLTQRDIRELQLAVGAIKAGVKIMLKKAGLEACDLDRVLIAGGFGSFIRPANARAVGLLPSEIAMEKVSYIGNASLSGAKWALLSATARRKAEELARRTSHIELSLDTNFQMEFAEAMLFPDTC